MALTRTSFLRRLFAKPASDNPSALAGRRRSGPPRSWPVAKEHKFRPRQSESLEPLGTPAPRIEPARSWAYQLQHIDPAEIAKCPADVVVIDTSPDGDWRKPFTADEVASMRKRDGKPDKKLIAYMSIGEAEEQRFYWQRSWVAGGGKSSQAPGWLHSRNTRGWTDNWVVKFWEPEWQRIICGGDGCFLDKILDQGFDGVYLDIIDAFEFWSSDERGKARRPTAGAEMISFVVRIAEHARRTRGKSGFLIVPQNGEGLLLDARYRATISGIGKEDILFDQAGQAQDMRISRRRETGDDSVEEIMGSLRHALADRIPILSVEYLRDSKKDEREAEATVARMRSLGFVPHLAGRGLDRLNETIMPTAVPSAAVA